LPPLAVAVLAITALKGLVPMSDFAPLLAVMIGLAVGIDYALFILTRYREELRAGFAGADAAGRALGTAGAAVTFAALTVVVALAALALGGISLLTEMGLAAACQWGWLAPVGVKAAGAVIALLPLVIVGVAFGLAMDYQFFLATRIREAYVADRDANGAIVAGLERAGRVANGAIVAGLERAGRVVGAAAGIMIAVFGAFGVLGAAVEIAQIGLALAIAIAVAAFVVRMTLIPAALALLRDRAWRLPPWLDRVLPDADVAGRRLAERLRVAASPNADGETARG
jgi:RND superfamily putative drug exporter